MGKVFQREGENLKRVSVDGWRTDNFIEPYTKSDHNPHTWTRTINTGRSHSESSEKLLRAGVPMVSSVFV